MAFRDFSTDMKAYGEWYRANRAKPTRTVIVESVRRFVAETAKAKGAEAEKRAELRRLLDERFRVQRQIQSLAMARRLLAVWHTVHIPIGVALFTLAFIHIAAAIYFATLIK